MVVPVYTATSSVWELWLLHISTNTYYVKHWVCFGWASMEHTYTQANLHFQKPQDVQRDTCEMFVEYDT